MKKRNKPVNKDTWSLFVDFVRVIDPDYGNYDEEGKFQAAEIVFRASLQLYNLRLDAWPSVIDEFQSQQKVKKSSGMDTSA